MKPRILIGTPTYDGKEYCLDFWVKIIRGIEKKARQLADTDLVLIDNSQSGRYSKLIKNKYKIRVIRSSSYKGQPLKTLAEARKKLYAIAKNYDYLLSIEQDIFPPQDIISNLLNIRKKIKESQAIIGVPYPIQIISECKRPFGREDFLMNAAIERMYYPKLRRMIQKSLTRKEMLKKKKVFKAYACGLGCTLIDTSILREIKVRYTEKNFKPDDAFLFYDCFKKNIPVYVDPTLIDQIIHIEGSNKSVVSWGEELFQKK